MNTNRELFHCYKYNNNNRKEKMINKKYDSFEILNITKNVFLYDLKMRNCLIIEGLNGTMKKIHQ